MYGISLDIRPTGGLTFRRMPGAILHISTYPFLPPTTMSGWLRRLLMLSAGHYPETDVKKPDYFALPPDYYVLGAYPAPDPQRSYQVHTTHRQGVRSFSHNAFSRLVRYADSKEVYQLHTWEYLIVDRLRGYVLHQEAQALEALRDVVNYGCKLGKEGYAYLESVSEVKTFARVRAVARPATLVSAMDLVGQPSTLYTLYRYQFKRAQKAEMDLRQLAPSAIEGFVPVRAGWPPPQENIKLDFWTDGQGYIPISLVELFYERNNDAS
jgi:hypothetical protein